MMKKKINEEVDFKTFIAQWNLKHPFDRYVRKKYNIPFGSKQHLQMNSIDSAIEYAEDFFMKQNQKQKNEADSFYSELPTDSPYLANLGENQEAKVIKMTKKEEKQAFAELNIDDY